MLMGEGEKSGDQGKERLPYAEIIQHVQPPISVEGLSFLGCVEKELNKPVGWVLENGPSSMLMPKFFGSGQMRIRTRNFLIENIA